MRAAIRRGMNFSARQLRVPRRPSAGDDRAACRYHDDLFRFTAAVRQAWLLSGLLVDSPRAGWKRPAEETFSRAFGMFGFSAELASRAWAAYHGAAGDDPRWTAVRELDREMLTVAKAQAVCGGKINRH